MDNGFFYGCVCLFVSLLCMGGYTCLYRRKRLYDDIPTSKTTGVFIGLVELKGTIESPSPMVAPLSDQQCVYCRWDIMEQWERWETETYYDSDSKTTKTRQVLKSGWTTLDESTTMRSFYLRDSYGTILVHPQQATLEPVTSFSETVSSGSPLYTKFSYPEIADSTHRRRFSEQIFPVGAEIYLMGYSRLRQDVVEPEIAYDPQSPLYLISCFKEETISNTAGCSVCGYIAGGLISSIAGALFLGFDVRLCSANMDVPTVQILTVLGTLGAVAALWGLNIALVIQASLTHLKNMVIQGLSNVDVQLKRRSELIPPLVQVVQKMAQYERETLQAVALLRSQTEIANLTKRLGKTNRPLANCALPIAIVSERYPELKSSELFLALQKQLTETESKIELARRYYNEIAGAYNTRLEQYPDCLISALFRMRPFYLIRFSGGK